MKVIIKHEPYGLKPVPAKFDLKLKGNTVVFNAKICTHRNQRVMEKALEVINTTWILQNTKWKELGYRLSQPKYYYGCESVNFQFVATYRISWKAKITPFARNNSFSLRKASLKQSLQQYLQRFLQCAFADCERRKSFHQRKHHAEAPKSL